MSSSANAAVLANFTYSEWDTALGAAAGTSVPEILGNTLEALTHTANVASGLDSVTGQSIDLSVPDNNTTYAGQFNFASWNTAGSRFDIVVTPTAGSTIDLTSLTLDLTRNGGGAPAGLAVSIDGGMTTIDTISGFAISAAETPPAGSERAFDLSSVADQTSAFTLTITSTDGNIGNLRISGIELEGTVVPEPSSLMLLGIGGLALTRRRRR